LRKVAEVTLNATSRNFIATSATSLNLHIYIWSEWRESNPRNCLGKATHYHYATLAFRREMSERSRYSS
jgi:hypothetical protein